MSDQLAAMFNNAVGMLDTAPARSMQLFTEITSVDDTACDAWIGRIRCGDADRTTLFRAWYSRGNLGMLAGQAEVSLAQVNARVRIGGELGDITYPVNSPLALTLAFAVNEAAEGNYADALEAVESAAVGGSEHLVAWVKAVIYTGGQRWTDVMEVLRGSESWPDAFLAGAAGVARGVAAANLGLFTEAKDKLTEANESPAGTACGRPIAWYLAMTFRDQGNEEGARRLLEWLQANFPEPKVAEALRDPNYRLQTTTPEKIAARSDKWIEQRRGGHLGARQDAQRRAGRTRPADRPGQGQRTDRDLPRRNANGENPGRARHEGRAAVQAHDLHRAAGNR